MSITKMHYDVKFKLNKISSSNYQNLRVPEIDIALNEAFYLFVKKIAEPRFETKLGFEISQRNIDSIRVLVKDSVPATKLSNMDYKGSEIFELPEDYMFYVSGDVYISKGQCKNVKSKLFVVRHNDRHEEDYNSRSNFEWREVNVRFVGNQLRAYHNDEFTIESLEIDYIKKLPWIHNAQAFRGGVYTSIKDGSFLGGKVDCPLPEHTHDEIVDIAVKIIAGIIEKPNNGEYDRKINFDWT